MPPDTASERQAQHTNRRSCERHPTSLGHYMPARNDPGRGMQRCLVRKSGPRRPGRQQRSTDLWQAMRIWPIAPDYVLLRVAMALRLFEHDQAQKAASTTNRYPDRRAAVDAATRARTLGDIVEKR